MTPPGGARTVSMKSIVKPALWIFYLVIVFEILFMISPFALHFYSAYGPTLNVLHRSPSTAWLTQFFLPHFSETSSPLLNSLPGLGGVLMAAGAVLFLAGAVPIYWARLRRRGAVTGGLYRIVRHPQYVGLAVVGLGTILVWPRFIALITYVTMLFLYAVLARWEEERCLARFGESYRAYQAKTGMFLPQSLSTRLPRILPTSASKRAIIGVGIYAAVMAVTVVLGFRLLDYSLSRVLALYTEDTVVLSTARLTDQELKAAYRVAITDAGVRETLGAAGPAKFVVHVVPLAWHLPDLPIEVLYKSGGHYVPEDFDRRHYKLLFTKARTHKADATGRDIVKTAYGRDPIVLVKVDVSAAKVTGVEVPPRHVHWGDISTPMF